MRKAAEALDDLPVPQRVVVAARRRAAASARRRAPGRRATRCARTAGRRRCFSTAQPVAVVAAARGVRAPRRAPGASVAKARGVPRNMLRGNWSSTMMRARHSRGASEPLAGCGSSASCSAQEAAAHLGVERRRPSRTSACCARRRRAPRRTRTPAPRGANDFHERPAIQHDRSHAPPLRSPALLIVDPGAAVPGAGRH